MFNKRYSPIIIVQARHNSSRLPGKIFFELSGYEIWYLLFKRLSLKFNNIVFAIPDTKENNLLYEKLLQKNIKVYRGSENDVILRFIETLENYNSNHFVRVCADNPYTCYNELSRLINVYSQDDYDYCYNNVPLGNSYPDGFGAEISSLNILKKIYNLTSILQREHIFNYIKNKKKLFKIKTFNPSKTKYYMPNLSFEVNTKKEYFKLKKLNIKWDTSMEDILKNYNENTETIQY